MTYKWIFAVLKVEMLKTSIPAVKRIGQRFFIKRTLNRKIGSGRPRVSTIKYNHMLKITVLKGIRKRLLSTAKRNSFSKLTKSRRVKEIRFSSKICRKTVFCGQPKLSFKTVILSMWYSFIVESLGRPEKISCSMCL